MATDSTVRRLSLRATASEATPLSTSTATPNESETEKLTKESIRSTVKQQQPQRVLQEVANIEQRRNPAFLNAVNKIVDKEVASERGEDDQKNQHKHQPPHHVAGLDCSRYDGPSPDIASEMVYWSDIPSDANYMSPFHNGNKHESDRKYMTFEPDGGGPPYLSHDK